MYELSWSSRQYQNELPLWRELDEKLTPSNVGRNDPSPCGSGKKFKKCCDAN